ncbi:MAG: hypothetical protein KAS59_10030 [Alphaproteobacteria bacterium]|nr:hypothetical protein [Alphaproteobacteria bacterium]
MEEGTENIGDSSTSSPSNGQKEEIEDSIYEIDFRIKSALRYCKKRCSTFEFLHNFCICIALFGGSTAVAVFSKYPLVGSICGLIVAAIFSADSAIDFSRRSEKYNNLFNRFNDLSIKIHSEIYSSEFLIRIKNDMTNIQRDVPATLRVLDVLCHNQEAKFQGIEDDQYEIDFWHRLLMNVWKFENWQPKKLSNNHLVQNTSK